MATEQTWRAWAMTVADKHNINLHTVYFFDEDPFASKMALRLGRGALGRFDYQTRIMHLKRGRGDTEITETIFHELTHAIRGPRGKGERQVHTAAFYETMFNLVLDELGRRLGQPLINEACKFPRARMVAKQMGLI